MCFTYSSRRGGFLDLFLGLMPLVTQATFACSAIRFSCWAFTVCTTEIICKRLWSWFLCLSSLFLRGKGEYAVSRKSKLNLHRSLWWPMCNKVAHKCLCVCCLQQTKIVTGKIRTRGSGRNTEISVGILWFPCQVRGGSDAPGVLGEDWRGLWLIYYRSPWWSSAGIGQLC